MGIYEFYLATPDEVEASPEALAYLERGAAGFGGLTSVVKAIQNCRLGIGKCVIVKIRNNITGAIYLTITEQETGRVMTSVLLGGDNFRAWAAELNAFYYKLAADNDCHEFMMMGRRGFKLYFPELIEVATIYRVISEKPPQPIK